MKQKTTYTFRKLINDIHLWLGLASGIVLFVVCLTGTVLAFEHEIKDFFAEKLTIEETNEKIAISSLVNTLKEKEIGFVTGVTLPSEDLKPYVFNVKKDLKERRGAKVLVNPFNAEVKKVQKTSADAFLLVMFKLHRWLMLDTTVGRPIVGIATIIFLILSITGIVLWFPRKIKLKNFKQGFKIKFNANWKRINHDLHNTLGFYACIFIIIMGLTGLCWSFEGYREGLSTVLSTKVFNRSSVKLNVDKIPTDKILTVDELITTANKTLDYKGELSVTFPSKRNNYYSFRKSDESSFSPVFTDKLYLDASGKVLAVDYFKDKPFNVKTASLIKPLHTGEIYGMLSKIIYFLACLIATSLPVTGTIIWLNKLKKNKKKK
ncbi:sulfite reductase [Polaribacter sp. BM10]|uniref:PepSY-associated TM helix domain-containing protein n=1 Tax=Polaribacter sp. BM10 TaxID=1529069 RepID=UPI000989CE40|nr:PepSY-associated TM helix domain-containing protein [Polaribacter sp. BM10]AQS94914.1 sulfite reductase [Polaribacter sp. BM10]